MADIKKIKDKIKSTIYPNGKGAINASDHQALLLDMADGMAETDTKLTELSEEVGEVKSFIEGGTSFTFQYIGTNGEACPIGETFFNTNSNLLRRKLSLSSYETVPFDYDYYYNVADGIYYIYNGTTLSQIPYTPTLGEGLEAQLEDMQNVVGKVNYRVNGLTSLSLKYFGTTGMTLKVGEMYFNTSTKLIRRRIGTGGSDFDTIAFEYDLYYNEQTASFYEWDGATMVATSKIPFNGIEKDVNGLLGELSNVLLEPTDWIATSRNYILKGDTSVLYHSADLGKTWKEMENTIGEIMHVHWFADGTLLLCTASKAYVTKDFESLTESTILDYDGTPFVGEGYSFFTIANYNSDVVFVDGAECAIWCDYGNASGYVSRLWIAENNGARIRCLLKNGASLASGGTLNITHFHACVWDRYEKCLWVATGDYDDTSCLLKGTCNNGAWSFEKILGSYDAKFGQLLVDQDFLYCTTDYVNTQETGLRMVAKQYANDISKYVYAYKNVDGVAFINYYEDKRGHKIMFPDSGVKNIFYYANGDVDFKPVAFTTRDLATIALHHVYGGNYNGDVVAITSGGYGFTTGITRQKRYLLATSLRNCGCYDFGKASLFVA